MICKGFGGEPFQALDSEGFTLIKKDVDILWHLGENDTVDSNLNHISHTMRQMLIVRFCSSEPAKMAAVAHAAKQVGISYALKVDSDNLPSCVELGHRGDLYRAGTQGHTFEVTAYLKDTDANSLREVKFNLSDTDVVACYSKMRVID